MSEKQVSKYFCDICEEDGEEEVEAVAYYKAEDQVTYDVCEEHLEHVKEAGLSYKKHF